MMNKKFTKSIALILVSLLCLSGCGQKTIPTLENGDQAIATLEDGTMISLNDFYNSLKSSYGLDTIVSMVDKIILEREYSGDLEAAKSSAETSISQLEEYYGDSLLSAIQYYTNYNTIEEYQDYLYVQYLEDKAEDDYAKSQISESDIKKYYKNSIKPDIKVSHILFSVTYDDDATDDEKTQAKEEAKAKAQEVLDILNSTSKSDIESKFAELAAQYSDDDSTKNDGGNLGYINTDTLGDSYEELVDAAYELKDGSYSKEIVETELGYHLVLRTETKEKASIDDVRDSIISALVDEYKTDNSSTVSIKAMQTLRKKYGVTFVDDDLASEYKEYIQNSLLEAQSSDSSSN